MNRTLSLLVDNRFGEIARIVDLLVARGIEIESLSLSRTTDPQLSRLTLVTGGPERTVDQLTGQFARLVRVLEAVDATRNEFLEREMVLVRMAGASDPRLGETLDLAVGQPTRLVERTGDALIVEITAAPDSIESILGALGSLGLNEVVRSGRVAISRAGEEAAHAMEIER